MARRAIRVIDIVELFQHWHAGRPMGELCSSLRIDPKTVRKYVAPAVAAGISPGGPPLGAGEWRALVEGWFPELVDSSVRQRTWPAIAPHHDRIKDWLGRVHVTTIHQRLRDDHHLEVSESSLRRYIVANFEEEVVRGAVRVLRETPAPGDEAQVDYGLLGRWLDPKTGRVRRAWAFIMVLSFSRLLFVRPVLTMDMATWVECHVAAFEFFGGAVARIVPDNLKTGVVKPDLYDPIVNKAFGEFAAHYGVLVDPARLQKPRDKARVERPVPYVRDSFFAGREGDFSSLPCMQTDAVRWCRTVANLRPHRGIDRVPPIQLFEAEEAAWLRPLPAAPFELCRWSSPKVPPDIHVKVGRALYSVPWRLIGKIVDAKELSRSVELYYQGILVATHVRIERGKQTNYDHYPPEKIAFMMRTPAWCRRRAAELGPSVAKVVGALMEVNALYRLRQAQGVIRLADRHGAERLEAACARAFAVGDPAYKTVKGILAASTEHDRLEEPQRAPTAPAHLHGPARLFASEAGR
jgi:transposase